MEDRLENSAFISAYFHGSLSDSERKEFEYWLGNNPAQQRKLDAYRLIWEGSSKLFNEDRNFERRWEKLSGEMESLNSKNTATSKEPITSNQSDNHHKIYRYLKVAAMLLLGITSAFFSMIYFSKIETIAEPGTTKELQLPDGSYITLNAASTVWYNKVDWWLGRRKVHLVGEAFFEVKKSKANFSVQTKISTITVLGTSFNIFIRDNKQVISCFTGRVKVVKHGDPDEQLLMGKGDRVHLESNWKMNSSQVSRFNPALAQPNWMVGEYYFQRTAIREVLDEIERRFNIDVVSSSDIGTLLFTGYINSETPDDALEVIAASMGVSWKKTDHQKYILE